MKESDATLEPPRTADHPAGGDGHPIQVRRNRAVFRLMEFFRECRKPIRNPAVAIAITLLVILVSVAAWWFYSERQPGWIELTNDGPSLTAQVLSGSDDEPIGEPFQVASRSILPLPDGDYRLRVHGVGRLGRTYRFAVNRGETQTHALSLEEGRLLGQEPVPRMANEQKPQEEPIPFAHFTAAVELTPGKADFIELSAQALIRRDGRTGKPVWDSSRPALIKKSHEVSADRLRRLADYRQNLQLVQPAPDLDGDGIGDMVWISPNMTSLLAVSGGTGSVLWEHALEFDGPGGPPRDDPELPGPLSPVRRAAFIVGTPAVTDLDGDGTSDLVAAIVFFELPTETEQRSPSPPGAQAPGFRNQPALARRVIQAISGRTGRKLWSEPIDRTFTTFSHPAWTRPATVVSGRKPAMVTYVDGAQWMSLDPATGKPRGNPIDLGFVPVGPVQYADLDGDGQPEIVAMGPGQAGNPQTLAAFALGTGGPLWSAPVTMKYENSLDPSTQPDWPLVVDLDGDGRSEIVVPDTGPMPPGDGYRGVRMLDGPSGRTRWVRPMRPETKGQDGLLQIRDAPDLDHDGVRDLITTSFFLGRYLLTNHNGTPPVPERSYVDALSGKDGHPLWWWNYDHPTDKSAQLWPLRWWGRGPDGWPLLAVPIGGQSSRFGFNPSAVPAIVHNLEASTGQTVSTAVGLGKAGAADLDGDGLADLWGEVDGQLRAFRGEAPEAWRALGSFAAAREFPRWAIDVVPPAADLDGDGIADTLISHPKASYQTAMDAIASHALGPFLDEGFRQVGASASAPPGSRTAVARSGRDGRVLWKTDLDPRRIWYEWDHAESYSLTPQPLPAGDLDGDGIPEVFVQKYPGQPGTLEIKRAATLPLQVLSGRTGRRLWSAGPLPLGFEAYGYSTIHWIDAHVVEPHGAPDVFVRHGSPFIPPSPLGNAPILGGGRRTSANGHIKPRLARVSGRDGRILWDIPLSDQQDPNNMGYVAPPGFDDLDGDGALDAVMAVHGLPGTGRPDHDLKAVSLRDGRLLWSLRLDYKNPFQNGPQFAVADLDGDKRPEVVVTEQPAAGEQEAFAIKVLEGRDGSVRWTWNGGAPENPQNRVYGWLCLADFAGDGPRTLCLSFNDPKGHYRILVFDEKGRERARRELPPGGSNYLRAADVNGDGRDELLVQDGENLHIWTHDLKDLWSRPKKENRNEEVLPASPGQPGTVLVPPAVGLDGADGHPRWAGQAPQNIWWTVFQTNVLDPGDSARLPRFLTTGLGATICRSALPTNPTGAYAPAQGTPVPSGLARNDPRWIRSLPWTLAWNYDATATALPAVIVLALFNVLLPVGILRLAARRRPWTLRLLMALPVAAAVPLTAFVALEPLIPTLPAPYAFSSRVLFTLGTLAGVPIVVLAAFIGRSAIGRRWKRLALLAGLTVLASLATAVTWLWLDMRTMPAIEHYSGSGWYLAVLPGAYVVGVLMIVAWAIRKIVLWRPRQPRRVASNAPQTEAT
jgi:hypothetical protein